MSTDLSKDLLHFALNATKSELEAKIKELQTQYYNANLTEAKRILSDKLYDDIIKIYENRFGEYTVIGAEAPVEIERVELPIFLGSLKKVRTVKEIELYLRKYPNHTFTIMDKIDGITILDTPTDAITRGGKGKGSLVTRIKKYINFPPIKDVMVRGELVMNKNVFIQKYSQQFENARNIIFGSITSKESFKPETVADLSFLAYRYINSELLPQSEQIKILTSLGFKVPWHQTYKPKNAEDFESYLVETLNKRQIEGEYDIDGLVIYAEGKYDFPSGKNPDHAISFKGVDESEITEVEYLDWEASKGSRMKPVIKIKEIFLDGVNINYITGNNARYIVENGIDTGAIVEVIRSGHVIPKIKKVLEPVQVKLPENCHWNESKVELITDEVSDETLIKQIRFFFETINCKFLGLQTITKIFNAGFFDIKKFLNLKIEDLMKIPTFAATSSKKVVDSIKSAITEADITEVLAGSYVLGDGFGAKSFKNILDKYPEFLDLKDTKEQCIAKLRAVGGFDDKAYILAENRGKLIAFLDKHKEITYRNDPRNNNKEEKKYESTNVQKSTQTKLVLKTPEVTESKVKGLNIIFTGFRDSELERKITSLGGNIKTSVSGKTDILVAEDLNESSTKMKAALAVNSKTPDKILIITKTDFISEYLQ